MGYVYNKQWTNDTQLLICILEMTFAFASYVILGGGMFQGDNSNCSETCTRVMIQCCYHLHNLSEKINTILM